MAIVGKWNSPTTAIHYAGSDCITCVWAPSAASEVCARVLIAIEASCRNWFQPECRGGSTDNKVSKPVILHTEKRKHTKLYNQVYYLEIYMRVVTIALQNHVSY